MEIDLEQMNTTVQSTVLVMDMDTVTVDRIFMTFYFLMILNTKLMKLELFIQNYLLIHQPIFIQIFQHIHLTYWKLRLQILIQPIEKTIVLDLQII